MDASVSNRYDAIVIGSGLGGLVAGALYARGGSRVLVLERQENFGGAATVYRHGSLSIEASLHEIDGLDPGDPKMPLLKLLDLDRAVPFVDVGDLHEIRGPLIGEPFVLPHGVDAALAAGRARFPRHADALRRYFDLIVKLRDALAFMSRHAQDSGRWWASHAAEALPKLWTLTWHGRSSVSDVLARLFGDDEAVKIAVAANLAYYHDDPDGLPFLHYAVPQASYLCGGGHYVRGGSGVLSSYLVDVIRKSGGVVEARREARRILLDGNRAVGIEHFGDGGDSRIDLAPVVFGNAAPHRLKEMLPAGSRERFWARYAGRQPSITLWTISLGLDRPAQSFGVRHYSTHVLPSWMVRLADIKHGAAIMADPDGDRLPPYAFVDYGQIDSGLNEQGPHLASLCGVDRLANWAGLSVEQKRTRKGRWMDRLIADLDRQFPGLAAAVVQREMATAETMQHYLNTPGGAVYGFAPESAGRLRVRADTAIDGLWLASAYTMGGGYSGAMVGGAFAARAAIAKTRIHAVS